MSAPALVRLEDSSVIGGLGIIWSNSASPVVIDSSTGYVPVIVMDQSQMPNNTAFPNPWCLRWRMTDVHTSISRDYNEVNINENHIMEMALQTSSDYTNWENWRTWQLTSLEGMTGRFRYFIDSSAVPQYIRVVAKIYPRKDGTHAQASMLMGMENMVL